MLCRRRNPSNKNNNNNSSSSRKSYHKSNFVPSAAFLLLLATSFRTTNGFYQQMPTSRSRFPLVSTTPTKTRERSLLRFPTKTTTTSTSLNLDFTSLAQSYSTTLSTTASGTAITKFLSQVSGPLSALSILTLVVTVHEAGHFLAARSLNIQVAEFSVGVGPKLLGFTKTVSPSSTDKEQELSDEDKEETIDYSLRLLPMGGYVRFPDNFNSTEYREMQLEQFELEEKEREKVQAAKATASQEKSMFSWIPKFESPKQKKHRELEEKQAEEEKAAAEAKQKNRIGLSALASMFKSDNNKKTELEKTEVKASKEIEIVYDDDPNLLQNRPWTQRAIVLIGGIVFNFIFAFACYFGEVTVGNGLPQPVLEPGAVIRAMPKPDAAAYGLIENGDIIVGYNGKEMTLNKRTSTSESQKGISEFIQTIRNTPEGGSISISVLRPSASSNNDVKYVKKDISVVPRTIVDPSSGSKIPPSIGITLGPNIIDRNFVKAHSLPEAISQASTATAEITTETASTLTNALKSMLFPDAKSTGPSNTQMSGPIGVVRMGSSLVTQSENQLSAIVAFAAVISINLAVVNALPIPGLDGGQLAFVLSEGLTGKKLDQKYQDRIQTFAVLFLLYVTIQTSVSDIGNLLK